ncbi:uncharacterized protein LOC142231250 [Haematobia irritans]|uniref:uncharacterized protein LOC142231250 n=1 Tax=Haematobia irritans TaxID=7368 RepID=UPI003F4F5B15
MSLLNTTPASSIDCTSSVLRILAKQCHGFNVCQLNAQSLTKKIDEFRHLFENSKIDIVCVSETWFTSSVADAQVKVDGYKIVRNDRSSHGGGVAVYVKNNVAFKVVKQSQPDERIEYVLIEIKHNGKNALVGAVYRPNSRINFDNFMHEISLVTTCCDDVILAGDYNSNALKDDSIVVSFNSIGLYNVNEIVPTHYSETSNTLLDLFLVDDKSKVLKYDQLCVPCFSKHDLIFMSYGHLHRNDECHRTVFDFKKIDYCQLYEEFVSMDWNAIYNKVSILHINDGDVLKPPNCMKNSCNSKTSKQVNKEISNAKRQHFEESFRSAVDSKSKWRKIREIGIGKPLTDTINANPDELNEKFLNFSDNSIRAPSVSYVNPFDANSSFEFSCITDVEVLTSFQTVRSNAMGLDNLHPRFIKIILPLILPYITHIFNTAIMSSTFPTVWKFAKIVPIPKPNTTSELRPIAILPFLSKVFEKLIHQQICNYLNINNLMTTEQSGFRQNHSCVTALVKVTDDIRMEMDKGFATILVLLDHSKAFDCVDYDILCSKLFSQYNFSNTAVSLLSSYLRNRSQVVAIGESLSNPLPLSRGVPQGSILGPLLFSIYVNDLPNQLLNSKIHLYADDVQIYLSCKHDSLADGVSRINEDLERVCIWAASNSLTLNPHKSKCMIITNKRRNITNYNPVLLRGQAIEVVNRSKNLGIIFNNNLSWSDHISSAAGKVFGMLRTLYHSQSFTPIHIRILLAKSYLLPILLYGCELFSKCDAKSKQRLESVYKAIIRYVFGLKRYDSSSSFINSLYGFPLLDLLKSPKLLLYLNVNEITDEPRLDVPSNDDKGTELQDHVLAECRFLNRNENYLYFYVKYDKECSNVNIYEVLFVYTVIAYDKTRLEYKISQNIMWNHI